MTSIEPNLKNNLIIIIYIGGPYSVLGRSVVVHENEDDLGKDGCPHGHSGKRIACGIIGISRR